MALASGTKLGPYEIQSPLGAGGMGEVYRARDTRLDRTVAIKVLPSHLSNSPDLKQRFEREARAISSLQHSHICTVHDVGSQNGVDFLVMEYLEGQTVADRLAKAKLPIDQALKIGIEIAQALETAHRQGIVHRDLKPGNIMLTKFGAKLMDFGLAKPALATVGSGVGPLTPSTPTMNLASLTSAASPLTQKGSIVGTYQYLAPEVLQGEEADARSDIFGLGCVLYEMVAGQRAFEGKSQLGVLTAILEKEPPPIYALDPSVPARLDQLVSACLAKDPSERFQSAHDVATELRWIAASTSAAQKQEKGFKKSWAVYGAVAFLLLLVVSALAGYWWSFRNARATPSIHAEISPPEKHPFAATGDFGGMPVLSPQGDKITFVAGTSSAQQMLWVRVLASDSAQPLDGTDGAAHPFWSPDGRYIGFFANKKLNTIPVSGGQISVVADAINSRGGTWGADNMIVFSADFRNNLLKVNAQGGPISPATVLDQSKHTTHRWPWFLPDGKHFLYLATNHLGGNRQDNGIYFASVDNPQGHMVVSTDSGGEYSSGYLLYRLNNALVAQSFDPESGKLSGAPGPVVSNVRYDSGVWRSIFAVSQNGVLIYQSGNSATSGTQLTWFDRSGKIVGQIGDRESLMYDPHISPDGKRVAFAAGNPVPSVWTIDLQRGTKTRVTFDQDAVFIPSWSPDGKTILFLAGSPNGGFSVIRTKNADGSGEEQVLQATPRAYFYPAWTPDGKYLTYVRPHEDKTRYFWRQSPVPNSQPVVILRPPSSQSNLYQAAISPDGRWVAYVSDESGENNLYITSFPEAKGKWQVSANGGAYPVWNRNGKELFFKSLTDDYYVSSIAVKGAEVEATAPKHLFHAPVPAIGIAYDVSLDGQRLLVNLAQSETTAPLIIVSNWTAELNK